MKLKDKSNAEQKRKIHNDIVADSNRDAHNSDVAKEMSSRTKFSTRGAKYDGRSRPPSELYRQRWNEIFGKKKITDENAEELVHGKDQSEEADKQR